MVIWILFLTISYFLIAGYDRSDKRKHIKRLITGYEKSHIRRKNKHLQAKYDNSCVRKKNRYLKVGYKKFNIRKKDRYLIVLIAVVVYFAAFRDGVGMDYSTYATFCERDVYKFGSWWLMEPLPYLMENFCYQTRFSAVIFFLLTSLLIYVLCFWVYSKYHNFYISAFVFLTYTNLFLSSLNIIRQFVAAAIILIGVHYFIIRKRSPLFFLFVVLAFLFHKTSILFLFLFWLRKDDFNQFIWGGLIIVSLFISFVPILNLPYIREFLIATDYLDYMNYTTSGYSKFSMSNIYMHLMALIFICLKSKIAKLKNKEAYIFSLKMFFLSIIFCNMSANDLPIMYRYAMFVSPFIPIIFSSLPKLIDKKAAKIIIYIPLIILLFNLLYSQKDNRVFCPIKILPIESVMDEYYHPFDNPDVVQVQ